MDAGESNHLHPVHLLFLCNLFAHFANLHYLCNEKPKTGRAVCFNPAPRPLLVALSNCQAHYNITENNLKTHFFHCFRFFCLLLCSHFAGLHPPFWRYYLPSRAVSIQGLPLVSPARPPHGLRPMPRVCYRRESVCPPLLLSRRPRWYCYFFEYCTQYACVYNIEYSGRQCLTINAAAFLFSPTYQRTSPAGLSPLVLQRYGDFQTD